MILKTYAVVTDITAGVVDLGKLDDEIRNTAHVSGFESLMDVSGVISVRGTSLSDEASLDALVLSHEAVSLAEYKQNRYNGIDYNTGVLISAGFTYDSMTFSLSVNAQANWNALKNNTSEFTFPKDVSTKDSNSYSLAEANVVAFWQAGKNAIEPILDGGRSLKKSVFDAVDKAAVDAIVDNR